MSGEGGVHVRRCGGHRDEMGEEGGVASRLFVVRIVSMCASLVFWSATYGHGSLLGEGKASVREFALPQPVLFVRVWRNLGGFLWDVARR